MRNGWAHILRCAGIVMVLAVLAACSGSDRGPTVRIFDGSGSNSATTSGTRSSTAPLPTGFHRVARGDTLYEISKAYGVSLRGIIERNQLSPPYTLRVGQVLALPTRQTHIVARGDTVYGISRRYGVAMNALVRANDIAPPFTIRVGQQLTIPEAVPQTASVPAPAPAPAPAPRVTQQPVPPPPSAPAPTPSSSPEGVPLPDPKPQPPARGTAPTAPPPTAPPPAAQAPPPAAPAEEGTFLVDRTFIPPAKPTPPPRLVGPIPRPPAMSGDGFLWPARGRVVSGFGPKSRGLHNDGINIAAPRGTPILASETGVVAYAGEGLPGFGKMILVKHSDGFVTAYAHADAILVTRGQIIQRGQAIARVGSTGTVETPQVHFQIRKGQQAIDPRRFLLTS